jgi:two-component system cell cycle sensor histidine kinase PleC
MMPVADNPLAFRNGVAKRALSSERAAKLELDQLRLVEANVQPAAYAMPAFALTLAVMLAAWVPVGHLTYWFIAVCVGSLRYWAGYRFLKLVDPKPETVRRWHYTLLALTLIANGIWVFPEFAFYSACPETGQMLFALVAGCSLTAGVAMLAPSGTMLWGAFIPYASALILPPILHGGPLHIGLAVLGIGLSLFILHLGRTMYIGARDLFLTREDKNDLIEQLAAAKIESDKARYRAEAASHAKSEFLANMSHELRTPLNAILGFSEIMKGEVFGPVGSPQYAEYAGHIHSSGEHLLGLINDVLDLSRIEAGRFVIKAAEIDLRDHIASALNLFAVRAAEGKIDLQRDIESDLPLLIADERALRQILLNLISNAVKFTPEHGTVTVFARRNDRGGLDLGVADCGVGISPNDLAYVFEAFGQGQHDISVREKGTGLGLPIVRGLVEAHGGKVSLTSEVGKGTTVIAGFPRERLTAPQPVPIRLAAVI